jgi:hypothetical protein
VELALDRMCGSAASVIAYDRLRGLDKSAHMCRDLLVQLCSRITPSYAKMPRYM